MQRVPQDQIDVFKVISIFNAQPDVLTAILKHRLGLKGHLGDVYIQIFAKDGSYAQIATFPHPEKKEVIVKLPFDPPLKDGWEARPTMFRYKREALAKYNVPEAPPVRYFKQPPAFPHIVPAGAAIAFWFYCAYAPGAAADACRAWIERTLGRHTIKVTGYFLALMHLFVEPAYLITRLRKHKTPLGPSIKWLLWTVVFGFGALDAYSECVLYEKTRHIYKQTDVGDIGPNVDEGVSREKKRQ